MQDGANLQSCVAGVLGAPIPGSDFEGLAALCRSWLAGSCPDAAESPLQTWLIALQYSLITPLEQPV